MELSLQSQKDYKSMRRIRQMMITKEKLHINDKIKYDRFLELYKRYGKGIEEKDFAKYVLDIPSLKHYYLQIGKTKETPILIREYVSPKDIDRMRKQVEDFVKNSEKKKFGYEDVEQIYFTYGGKLDMAVFAEEVLGISSHTVECMKSVRTKTTKFFVNQFIDRIEIRKRQNAIILGSKLHIDDTITKEQFENLYTQYGKGLSESEFAIKILQIPQARFNRLKNGRNLDTRVLSRYAYNMDSVFKLRENVITREKLHISQEINYSRFKELYIKYAGPLSEELFAEEILDLTVDSLKNMRNGGNGIILTNIAISEEFVFRLRDIIASENDFRQNQEISLEKIEELYKKYGGILSPKLFAIKILDISIDSYNSLKCGGIKKTAILRNYEPNRFWALRRKIILHENLHYEEEMDYTRLSKLHRTYAPQENEAIFAERIFDIPTKSFYNLSFGSTKKVKILKDEPLPSDEELQKLKFQIALEYGLHIKDTMSYTKFKTIYNRYGGIFLEEDFARIMFDISKNCYKKMRDDFKYTPRILSKTMMSESEIKKLRREVILDNDIYPEKPITHKEFKKIYKSYEHILSQRLFAELILGVDGQCLNKLKAKECESIEALHDMKAVYSKRPPYLNDKEVELLRECLILGLSDETIATRLFVTMPYLKRNVEMLYRYDRLSLAEIEAERIARGIGMASLKVKDSKPGNTQKKDKKESEKRLKESEVLGKKVNKVLEDFEMTEKDIQTVRAYIENCSQRFKYGEFPEIELPKLEECIDFVIGQASDIKLYSRVCVSFGLYKKASVFISNNIDNDGINPEDKLKLKKFQRSINYANQRQNAVNMISRGTKDAKFISAQTGIAEVDVLDMQKRLGQGLEIDVKGWLNRDLDEED